MDRRKSKKKSLNKKQPTPPKKQKITDIQTERKKRIHNASKGNIPYDKYSRPYKGRKNAPIDRNYKSSTSYTNAKYKPKVDTYYKESYSENIYKKKRKKEKKRYLNKTTNIFTAFLMLLIILYFSVSIIKGISKKPIEYNVINYGAIDNHTKVDGVIIRDEIVYKAPKDGIVEFNITENEKVKKNTTIAQIKDAKNLKTTENDIKNINKQILKLQEKRKNLSLFSEDIKKIDIQIQNMLEYSISDFLSYEMSQIYEVKDDIEKKINIKNQKLLSENTGGLKDLAEKRNKKEKELEKNITNIVTNHSGIVSYYTDGLENIFTNKNINNITKEQTKMKKQERQEFKLSALKDEPIFKIVTDNTFYIVSFIKTSYIQDWEKGQEKTIYINDNGTLSPLDVFIDSISIKDKDSFVILRCDKNIIDYIAKRNITFDINMPKEGFKIEKNAILTQKLLKIPKDYVNNETVTKKTVDNKKIINISSYIKDEDDMYLYINIDKYGIDIGDILINKDKAEYKLNETVEMDGIYIVNSGTYSFIKINMANSTKDDQFVILDPNKNKSIRLYDRYSPNVHDVIRQGGSANDNSK